MAVHLHTDLLDLEGEAVATGTTHDAARGGLFVKSDFLEPPGTEVRLTVHLDGEEVPLQGQVAWVAEGPPGPGMGIRLETTAESRRLGDHLLVQAS